MESHLFLGIQKTKGQWNISALLRSYHFVKRSRFALVVQTVRVIKARKTFSKRLDSVRAIATRHFSSSWACVANEIDVFEMKHFHLTNDERRRLFWNVLILVDLNDTQSHAFRVDMMCTKTGKSKLIHWCVECLRPICYGSIWNIEVLRSEVDPIVHYDDMDSS